LMLHIAPKSVRMEAIEPKAVVSTFDWAEEDLLRTSRVSLYRSMKQITANGVWGDATHATAAKGKQITDLVCNALSIVVSDLST
jgi:creatinine amidohydrolase